MVDAYGRVLECHGRISIQIYVWEDGKIETLMTTTGANEWLAPRSGERRELYRVTTVEERNFDPWDLADHPAPEDDAEREAEEAAIIEECVDEYKSSIFDRFDTIVENADQEEKCSEMCDW